MISSLSLLGKNTLSIDIGSNNIKLIEGSATSGKVKVNKAFTLQTPRDSFSDGYIQNIQGVASIIRETIESEKIKTKATVCTFESSAVITREVLLPLVKPQEMRDLIKYEIKQYLPIDIEQYVLGYRILEELTEGNVKKANILVAATPKDVIKGYSGLLSELKLKPLALDIHSNSIDKLLFKAKINGTDDVAAKRVAMIDLGHSNINITIFKNGIYQFNRLIKAGGRDIDFNISNSLGISLDEAREKKHQLRFDSRQDSDYLEHARIQNIVKRTIEGWVEEIRNIFRYYLSRNVADSNSIEAVYLYGGNANIDGITEYLKEFFVIPIVKLDNITTVNLSNFKETFDMPSYANALGAIIRR